MFIDALLRGIIPFIFMTGLTFVMALRKVKPHQVRGTFIVGLIWTVVAASSVIYELADWSIYKQLFVHFVVMTCTVLPLLYLSGWFNLKSFLDYVKVFLVFLLIGAGIVMAFSLYEIFRGQG